MAGYSVTVVGWTGCICCMRVRVAGNIQQTWPEAQVTETPNSGYRYRAAHIRRDAVGKAIAEAVTDIDYIKLQEQYRG